MCAYSVLVCQLSDSDEQGGIIELPPWKSLLDVDTVRLEFWGVSQQLYQQDQDTFCDLHRWDMGEVTAGVDLQVCDIQLHSKPWV